MLDIDYGPGREDLGFKFLEMIRSLDDAPPVIMLSGLTQLSSVVRAIKMGAFHYLSKPPQPGDLFNLINLALADTSLRNRLNLVEGELARRIGDEIVAEDPLTKMLLDKAKRVAPTESTVLITGETGTGKEVIANMLHRLSTRCDHTMVSFNCTSVPGPHRIGDVRLGAGAYTGAERTRKGKFELASGSTLFLDEIGDSPLEFQVKLLRAIECKEIERLGGDGPIAVDVRLIAATNKVLDEEVAAGRFREDLLYRLNVVELHLPPLRERRLDILPLARHFLLRQPSATRRGAVSFTPFAEDAMLSYDWPGNVRELAHTVERAAILGRGSRSRSPISSPILRFVKTTASNTTTPSPSRARLQEALPHRPARSGRGQRHQGRRTQRPQEAGVSTDDAGLRVEIRSLQERFDRNIEPLCAT